MMPACTVNLLFPAGLSNLLTPFRFVTCALAIGCQVLSVYPSLSSSALLPPSSESLTISLPSLTCITVLSHCLPFLLLTALKLYFNTTLLYLWAATFVYRLPSNYHSTLHLTKDFREETLHVVQCDLFT